MKVMLISWCWLSVASLMSKTVRNKYWHCYSKLCAGCQPLLRSERSLPPLPILGPQYHPSCQQSRMILHNTAPPLAAAAGTQAGSGSSSGSNSTQEGFSFVCSLCLRPQHTPKTHCEHMRRLSENLGNCSLSMSPDLMPDRHRRVLAVFGNPQSFANWCVPHCSICDVSVTNC